MLTFDKARIQAAQLMQQSFDFLTEQFQQVGKVFVISSGYGQILTVIGQLSDMILFYIEDSITELNILTASRTQSVYGLARLTGHNPTRAISATGEISLNLKKLPTMQGTQIILPNFSRVKCLNNGQTYTVTLQQEETRMSVNPRDLYYVPLVQGELQTQTFTGTGTPLQSFVVLSKGSSLVDNFYVKVYVNGELWRKYDSLLDIPRNGKGFLVKTGVSGGVDLFFGNTNFGMIPPRGAEIRVEYLLTGGEIGNLREGEDVFFQWIDPAYSVIGEEVDLNESHDTKMSKLITFGSNPEPTFLTRLIAPHQSRSFVLANPSNYIIFLQKFNYFSVVDAYNTFGDQYLDDDNVIYLFLIPDITKRIQSNENYFTIPLKYFTLTPQEEQKVIDVIEESGSKIVTTVVKIVDPEIRRYVINVNLITFEGFSKDVIRNQIIDNLSEYFLNLRRRDRVPKSDITKIIESIDGVDSVNVSFVSEANEIAKKADPNAALVGLDNFGDILIGRDEIPVIKGGWKSRDGVMFEDGLFVEKPSALNVSFDRVTKKDINSQLFEETMKNITNKK